MKIGLISDIHSDIKSLRLALDLLQSQGVEQVVCAGDLVDKGIEGDAVVQTLRDRDIPCVVGNHDGLAKRNQYFLLHNYGHSHPMLLSDETLEYLIALPETLTYTWAALEVVVAHGTPWSRDEYLFPYSKPELFKQIAEGCGANVLILGHTHQPMLAHIGNVWICNPGSLCGATAHGSGTCATLSLPDCTFHVFDIRSGQRVQPCLG